MRHRTPLEAVTVILATLLGFSAVRSAAQEKPDHE